MSTTNNALNKQPFKLIEIPLNKFLDDVIPHHEAVFEAHKNLIQKILTKDLSQACREIRDKKRIVRQLKDLMYELDTLRTQVEDSDLGKFDSKTVSLRKTILELTRNYTALENKVTQAVQDEIVKDNNQNSTEPKQLQIVDDLTELKLLENRQTLEKVDALNKDIEDVHGIFNDLNEMVAIQKEYVDRVETNVEDTRGNIHKGLGQLIKASKLKKASYPVAGAVLGSIIGGPIGSLAGLKIGGLAAVGCGVVGYLSGKFIKKTGTDEVTTETISPPVEQNHENVVIIDKKDI